jgi:hypothetical protein
LEGDLFAVPLTAFVAVGYPDGYDELLVYSLYQAVSRQFLVVVSVYD